jgi:hypothetical protein
MSRAAVCLVICAAGCAAPSEPTVWSTQLDHVRQFPDPHNRASALTTVAEAAAMAGDADTARAALDDLDGYPARDELAGRCVGHLAAGGKEREARRLAKVIADRDKRDEVLAKIAPKPKEETAPDPAAVPVGGK